jgi:hypothetical protein
VKITAAGGYTYITIDYQALNELTLDSLELARLIPPPMTPENV